MARANTMAGFIIFFHINDDFWRLWTLVLMMMLYRRSSSDPNWSVVVGSPRPQTKERPAVAGPCLICIFLLLRCNKEISPFTFPSLPKFFFMFTLSFFFPSTSLSPQLYLLQRCACGAYPVLVVLRRILLLLHDPLHCWSRRALAKSG